MYLDLDLGRIRLLFFVKKKALDALSDLILKQKAKRVILSYSNEGNIELDDLIGKLSPYGDIKLVELKTIGRYRPNKVAVENRSEVNEYLVDFSRKQGENEQTTNTRAAPFVRSRTAFI